MTETNPIVTAYQGGVGEVGPTSPADIERARLTVADNATDAAEARWLLDMLGLLDTPGVQR